MRAPDESTVASMAQWEQAFFESEFTHIYGSGHFTRHAGGVASLWRFLAGKSTFPAESLSTSGKTLTQFAEEDH